MAKRFVDTGIWKKKWFRELAPTFKEFWRYLYENCDNAGVWEPDYETASWFINDRVTADDLGKFGDRVELLPSGKVFLRTFVEFQYGALSPECKPHKQVISILQKNGIDPQTLTPSKGYAKGMERDKDKDKDKDKDSCIQEGGVGETRPSVLPIRIDLIALWQAHSGELPKILPTQLTRFHYDQIRERLKENSDPKYWEGVIKRMASSKTVTGRSDLKWRADFLWLITPGNHTKVAIGRYDDAENSKDIDWSQYK